MNLKKKNIKALSIILDIETEVLNASWTIAIFKQYKKTFMRFSRNDCSRVRRIWREFSLGIRRKASMSINW